MRQRLDILHELWPNLDVIPVTEEDHFHTNGASQGACMKLAFFEGKQYVGSLYVFPDGTHLNLSAQPMFPRIVDTWIRAIRSQSESTPQETTQASHPYTTSKDTLRAPLPSELPTN
jgi:hypothetical protein